MTPEGSGPFYPYFYGTTFFVPGLGPVAGIERHVFAPAEDIPEGFVPLTEYVLNRVGATFPE